MKTAAFLSACILAISQVHVAAGKTTKFTATFDDREVIPEEGDLNPVGTYQDIAYTNFNLNDPAVQAAGLRPQSTPNDIFGVGQPASPAAMTTSYTGSKVKSLALESFYYGCQADLLQGAASLPVKCTITVTGYRGGAKVAVQEFPFNPAKGLTAPLAFGKFKSAFTNLQTVTYERSPSTGTEFLLDNIVGSKQT